MHRRSNQFPIEFMHRRQRLAESTDAVSALKHDWYCTVQPQSFTLCKSLDNHGSFTGMKKGICHFSRCLEHSVRSASQQGSSTYGVSTDIVESQTSVVLVLWRR